MPQSDGTDILGDCFVDYFNSRQFVPYAGETGTTTTGVTSLAECESLVTASEYGNVVAQYDSDAGICIVYQQPFCYQEDLVEASANFVALLSNGCQK